MFYSAFCLHYREIAMRTFHQALVAGGAAVAIGVSGAAFAQSANSDVMTVRLPDGGIAQIRYTGNVAPRVSFSEAPAPVEVFAPTPSLFGSDSPFAAMERISAEMDRQATAMFRQADTLLVQPGSGQLTEAALRSLPPGSQSYSFVSTMSGSGVCSQSVEITSPGNGQKPRVVRHSSGDCGPSGGAAGSANLPSAAPPGREPGPVWTNAPAQRQTPNTRPDVIWTSAKGAKPYAGLVREIPAAQR
jgi:hypothetical protein